MKPKFFRLFKILHFIKKQTYKLELLKKLKIDKVFNNLLLEKENAKKEKVDKNVIRLNFNISDNKKYKVKAIWNSVVYTKNLKMSYLPRLYYLDFWKIYLRKKKLPKAYSDNIIRLKTNKLILETTFLQTDNNLSINQYSFTDSQVNSKAK